MFSFIRNNQEVFQDGRTILHSHQPTGESSCCSTSLTAFGVCSGLNFGHLWYLTAVLICSSLKTWCGASFLPSLVPPSLHPSLFLFLNSTFPWWLSGEEFTFNAGDVGSIPGSRRSPGEGNGNPLQYSCLGNSTDRGAWRAKVHSQKRRTWLSD